MDYHENSTNETYSCGESETRNRLSMRPLIYVASLALAGGAAEKLAHGDYWNAAGFLMASSGFVSLRWTIFGEHGAIHEPVPETDERG